MSKLGRYHAQRLKIVEIGTSETKAVKVSECGTIFTCAGGAGTSAITLPLIADAGAGWWCKFILLADEGANNTTVAPAAGDEDTIVAANYGGLGDDTNSANVGSDAAADSAVFVASNALAGDSMEFICTGSKWILQAFSTDADAGITLTT
jgi:hypothetical protein